MRRWRLLQAALIIASAQCAAAHAQDAVRGKRLFEDTPNASGLPALTGACTSCHGTVENRRARIAGDPYAEINPAFALERFRVAIASVGAMAQFDALQPQQQEDIAAYLADTPRRSAQRLDLTATAVRLPAPVQSVDLHHALATTEALHVVGVGIGGPDAARFSRSADTCDQQTLAPAASCRVTVGYSAPDTAGAAATLTLTLRQGSSVAEFTRTVALSGVVSTAPLPPPPAASQPATGSDTGGGAVQGGWLSGLVAACLLLARIRRRPG